MKTRVIIGAGTAAAVFLKTMATGDWETVVVGSDGLWAQLPDKPMEQPAHLLQLPRPFAKMAIRGGSSSRG